MRVVVLDRRSVGWLAGVSKASDGGFDSIRPRVFLESVSRLPTMSHLVLGTDLDLVMEPFQSNRKEERKSCPLGARPRWTPFWRSKGGSRNACLHPPANRQRRFAGGCNEAGQSILERQNHNRRGQARASGAVSFTCGNWRSIFIAGSFKSCPHVWIRFRRLMLIGPEKDGVILCVLYHLLVTRFFRGRPIGRSVNPMPCFSATSSVHCSSP